MDLLKSEFLYRIRSFLDPSFKQKNFNFYIHKIKLLAPVSFHLQKIDFFIKTLPDYFKEIHHNPEDLTENILYLPLYYKKYQSQLNLSEFWIELLDYEFSCYQISLDPTPIKKTRYNNLTNEIFSNPVSQALRLEYDVHRYVREYQSGNKILADIPKPEKNLLLISKNPENKVLSFTYGNIYHAAVLDELHDGKVIKKDLIQKMQISFPEIAQREWIVALKELKDAFVITED